jgi:hypothetical protein
MAAVLLDVKLWDSPSKFYLKGSLVAAEGVIECSYNCDLYLGREREFRL